MFFVQIYTFRPTFGRKTCVFCPNLYFFNPHLEEKKKNLFGATNLISQEIVGVALIEDEEAAVGLDRHDLLVTAGVLIAMRPEVTRSRTRTSEIRLFHKKQQNLAYVVPSRTPTRQAVPPRSYVRTIVQTSRFSAKKYYAYASIDHIFCQKSCIFE